MGETIRTIRNQSLFGQGWQTKAFTVNVFPSYCSDCEFIMPPAVKAQSINVAKTRSAVLGVSAVQLAFKSPQYDCLSSTLKAPV